MGPSTNLINIFERKYRSYFIQKCSNLSFFLKNKKFSTGIWTPAFKTKGECDKTHATEADE